MHSFKIHGSIFNGFVFSTSEFILSVLWVYIHVFRYSGYINTGNSIFQIYWF
jgi:hypothetical protein